MKKKSNNKVYVYLTLALICGLLVVAVTTLHKTSSGQKKEFNFNQEKVKVQVGKLCVELEETPEQFRAKQDLWDKAFGFHYLECR